MRYLAFALLAPLAASAGTILTVSESGTFGPSAQTTLESAPNESWSFSFEVNSTPSVSNVDVGNYFDPAFTDFTYTLNGSPVAVTVVAIPFLNGNVYYVDGGLQIVFSDGTMTLETESQLYSGSESSPTILTGVFPLSNGYMTSDTAQNSGPPFSGSLSIEPASAPEPSSLGLLLSGAAMMAGAGFARRKRCSRV